MESRYVRLDFAEAVSAKKELLSSEINILKIAKNIENYRLLRKRELQLKTKLKSAITELKTKLNLMESGFPEGFEKVKIKTRKADKKETKKSVRIQDELDDIRAKLARLQ